MVLGHEETYFVKEHSYSKNKYSEDDIIKMLEFLVDIIFVAFAGKVFQRTVCIPIGIHTKRKSYGLCSHWEETVSISVQSHLQIHRWCIFHKQPRIPKLSGPDVYCLTWDQGHHREHHFCFLRIFTTVNWEGWSTSHSHLRQTRWFQFQHHKLSVPEK